MTLIVELENGTKVEIEEKIHGHYFKHCEGGYEQESEFVNAWIHRNGKVRPANVQNVVMALERRLGSRWTEQAVVED